MGNIKGDQLCLVLKLEYGKLLKQQKQSSSELPDFDNEALHDCQPSVNS